MDMLVDAAWLKEHGNDSGLRIIEAPWKPEGYSRAHIDGALCLPWHSYLKGVLENGERSFEVISEKEFRSIVDQLGLRQEDHIVVYDEYHGLFATRFWWVFNYYGFSNVSVLNGGWQEWLERGYPISSKIESVAPGSDIEVCVDPDRIVYLEELLVRVGTGDVQVWDARRKAEYDGEEETSNRRDGHIPGAINLDWTDLLKEAGYEGGPRRFKSVENIEALCAAKGLQKEMTIVSHCQASIRGAFASFILEYIGYGKNRLYDGAMAEWANLDHTPLTG